MRPADPAADDFALVAARQKLRRSLELIQARAAIQGHYLGGLERYAWGQESGGDAAGTPHKPGKGAIVGQQPHATAGRKVQGSGGGAASIPVHRDVHHEGKLHPSFSRLLNCAFRCASGLHGRSQLHARDNYMTGQTGDMCVINMAADKSQRAFEMNHHAEFVISGGNVCCFFPKGMGNKEVGQCETEFLKLLFDALANNAAYTFDFSVKMSRALIDVDGSKDLTKKEILSALSSNREAAAIIRGNPKLAPLGKPRTPPEVARLAEYCHVLFNANLFLYLD